MNDDPEISEVNHGDYECYKNKYASVRITVSDLSPGQLDVLLQVIRKFCKNPTGNSLDHSAMEVEKFDMKTHRMEGDAVIYKKESSPESAKRGVGLDKSKAESKPKKKSTHSVMSDKIIRELSARPRTKVYVSGIILRGYNIKSKEYGAFYSAWNVLSKKGMISTDDKKDRASLWRIL